MGRNPSRHPQNTPNQRCANHRRNVQEYILYGIYQRASLLSGMNQWYIPGGGGIYTATVNVSSLRVTARYSVSRSNGTRPASVISRTRSARRIPCGVVAPASW